MKKSKFVLFRIILILCFIGSYAVYSQNLNISVSINLEKKEILTYVNLSELPSGIDIVWQQKIPRGTHFSSYTNNRNTDGKMIVLNFSKHLHTSTMTFSFICKIDSLGEELSWGESTLIYTDAEAEEHVIHYSPKIYIVAECLSGSAQHKEVVPVENVAENNEKEVVVIQKVINADKIAASPIENFVNDDENKITSIVEEVEIVDEEMENRISSTVSPPKIQNESAAEGGYYIQLFALKNKRSISDVKKLVQAQGNDDIVERQKDVLFVYLVGIFSSKEEADAKLEYYKKYAPGAFVTK